MEDLLKIILPFFSTTKNYGQVLRRLASFALYETYILLTFALYPALAKPPEDARSAEPQLLRPGIAERQGDRLVLTAGSHSLVFTDNRKACDDGDAQDCAVYKLVANVPGSLAVRKFEFEGSDTTLVDTRSGKETLLTGVPVFSPDGGEFVVAEFSNDSDNNLEVWRRDGDGVKLEWAHPFKQSWVEDRALLHNASNPQSLPPVYRVTAWHGDRITLAVSTDDQRYRWTGSLTRDERGWHLSAKSPPEFLR